MVVTKERVNMQQQTFYKQFHPLVLLTLAVLVSRNIGGELFQVELKFVRLNVDEPTELQMFFYQLKFHISTPGFSGTRPFN